MRSKNSASRLQACGDQRERDQRPRISRPGQVIQALLDRSGHPLDQVRVIGEEPFRGPHADPLIVEASSQHRLRRRVRVDQADVVDQRVDDDVIVFEHGHRPITARAAANSAASASGARCTYLAVVSGEAWPISSRNTRQIDPGRCQLGRVGVPQPMRPHPCRTGPGPVHAEHLPQPGLGDRPTPGRAPQHHEALRGPAARWAFAAQIGGALVEERSRRSARAVHGHPCRPPARGACPCRHRPAATPAPRPSADRPAPSPARSLDPGACSDRRGTPTRRRCPGSPATASESTPTVTRPNATAAERRDRACPAAVPATPTTRRARGTGLRSTVPSITKNSNHDRTVDTRRFIVAGAGPPRARCQSRYAEQIHRRDSGDVQPPLGHERVEVRQVERVRPHRRRREAPDLQVLQEPIRQRVEPATTDKTMTHRRRLEHERS